MLAGLALFEMLSQYPRSASQGFCGDHQRGSAAVCDPNPPRPFARVRFWQNGFFADFYFWAAGFFRGFSRRIFSPHFCGKKCPEKSSSKIPAKILQNLYNKNPPTHFCRMAGATFARYRITQTSDRPHFAHVLHPPPSMRVFKQRLHHRRAELA